MTNWSSFISCQSDWLEENDMLKLIFSFLDLKSLQEACLVCKNWKDIVTRADLLSLSRLTLRLEEKNLNLPVYMISHMFQLAEQDEDAAFDLLCEYSTFRHKEIVRHAGSSISSKPDQRKSFDLTSQRIEQVLREQRQICKVYWSGPDKEQRPSLVLRPALHYSDKRNSALLFALILFEQACERIWKINLRVKDFAVILDFHGFGTRNFDLYFARTFIGWSRKYYKNLLGVCYTIRSPSYGMFCWNIVKMLVPAATIKKINIIPGNEWRKILTENFALENLPVEYGGEMQLPPGVKKTYSESSHS
eukprot:TRINITY_DN13616_c0_g1_i1.p1 TRINITY_DN13616_c0_g1~~TRINITY_DN13616_c0_g1_i1.p1  ORF type:complete len:305 (+),score=27.57 TRINITY_DN13616_c0_g1_i1:30-944(+)